MVPFALVIHCCGTRSAVRYFFGIRERQPPESAEKQQVSLLIGRKVLFINWFDLDRAGNRVGGEK
ncbi:MULTISPECIES: hypothetical protein [unclassified Mycobacterium]|uniref:hypothetical protein n=1 Tax=unclassified Mycobacterium TaxID=2642494 RepID=UPI000ACDFCBB|nr:MULTISPECIES: hypothetical protein [unclassified Mycobacterium]